jgi:hypothetical protein
MAKQAGDIIIVGTIDDITFYQMDGQGYARRKSSLKGTRVKKDPRFKRTMKSADRMARSSQLASQVYRSIPREEQVYALFTELKSVAIYAFKEERSEEEVWVLLQQRLVKTESEAPEGDGQTDAPIVKGVQQAPKLFKVYGGEVEIINAQARKEERRRDRRWVARCKSRRVSAGRRKRLKAEGPPGNKTVTQTALPLQSCNSLYLSNVLF